MSELDAMKRRVLREREARKAAELLAEEKTRDLFEANEELKGLTDHLEEMVESRTSQLELARDEALAASRAKSEFLANMSHEIRTPLNAVIGLTELMLDTPLNVEQRDFATTIHASGEALLAIINDILDFSKIESGHMELESVPFDLRRCVEGTLDLLAGKAAEKGLELAYGIDGQTPAQVIGDETRFRQVLLNLVNNAIKFTDVGEVIVDISTRGLKFADGRAETYEIEIAVRDTGIGIPPERMDRLFKSFSQVDASTTRKFGGTGLGLAISQRLAHLMGGDLKVTSEGEGLGSTFTFRMVCEAAPNYKHVYLQRKEPKLDDRSVLVVDDNETNRRILDRQLGRWGLDVETVANGPEALEKLAGNLRYDLVVSDMQMPGMDGLMLAELIRRQYDAARLPIIMLTSLGCRPSEMTSGAFDAILTKPVKNDQLFEAIQKSFSNRPPRRADVVAEATDKPVSKPVEAPSPLPTTPSSVINSGHSEPPRANRLLIAEDNLINQKVVLNMLKRLGYTADVVDNGLEAVKAVKEHSYEIVLMDIQMPEMGGEEATQRIREEVAADRQPWVIALTANALVGDRERFLAAGMDDYISKPVKQATLAEKLESRLLDVHA